MSYDDGRTITIPGLTKDGYIIYNKSTSNFRNHTYDDIMTKHFGEEADRNPDYTYKDAIVLERFNDNAARAKLKNKLIFGKTFSKPLNYAEDAGNFINKKLVKVGLYGAVIKRRNDPYWDEYGDYIVDQTKNQALKGWINGGFTGAASGGFSGLTKSLGNVIKQIFYTGTKRERDQSGVDEDKYMHYFDSKKPKKPKRDIPNAD